MNKKNEKIIYAHKKIGNRKKKFTVITAKKIKNC